MSSLVPEVCPSCKSDLEWSNTYTDLFCRNPFCSAQNIRNLIHFFGMIEVIDGFGPKTLEKLNEFGYNTIEYIYDMHEYDFIEIGFGPKQSYNLYYELQESRKRPIPEYRFLAALGINNLGLGSSKKLMDEYELYYVLEHISQEELRFIDGFGSETSYTISRELRDRQDLITIYNIGFNLVEEKIEVTESSITGKNMCFTGKMKSNRKEMEKKAEALGAKITGVNSKTDILVTGDKVGSNKISAASKHNVKVISEDEYYNLIGE